MKRLGLPSVPTWAQGPLLTLAIIASVQTFSTWFHMVQSPSPVMLLAVAVSAVQGGVRSGLLSAALSIAFLAYFWSAPGRVAHYTPADLQRLTFLTVSGPAMAILVGLLRRRAWHAAREAERQRRRAEARHADAEARFRETSAMLAIAQIVSESADLGESLRRVCRELSSLTGADTVSAYLKDVLTAELRPIAAYHVPREALPTLGHATLPLTALGFAREAFERGQVVWSDHVPEDRRFDHPLFRRFAHQSGAVVPVSLDSQAVGAFYLTWWTERRALTDLETATLRAVGQQLGVRLRNIRLREALRVRADRLATLANLNREISASLDMNEVLTQITRAASVLMGAPLARIWLADAGQRVLHGGAIWDAEDGLPFPRASVPFGTAGAGWVAEHAQTLSVPDVFADDRFVHRDWWRARGFQSYLAAPILRNGEVNAVLAMIGRQPFRLDADEERLLESLVAQASAAVRNAALYRALDEVKASLAEALRRNESVLNATSDGIYGLDRHGRVSFVNPAACAMTGFAQDEVLGQFVHGLVHHSRADGSPYPQKDCPATDTLRRGVVRVVRDEILWRKDGTSLEVEYISGPIREGREVVGAVVTVRDATERRAIERMKDDFIATVSHQLRTPLTAIRGHLELTLDGDVGPLTDAQEKFLRVAIESADRLGALVNDLLDVDRIERGRIRLRRDPVDVARLLENVGALFRVQAEHKGLALHVDHADVPPVQGDYDRLVQAFSNLVANAVRYTERGEVRLGVGQAPDGVEIVIADTGVGIPEGERSRLFSRFFRGEHPIVRGQAGTGLGLVITKGIIEEHGGRISVDSGEGPGIRFRVLLPLEPCGGAGSAGKESGSNGEDPRR